jgi:hypothetical protein
MLKVSISPDVFCFVAYLTVTFILPSVISNLAEWKQAIFLPGPQSLSYAAFTTGWDVLYALKLYPKF